MDLKTFFENFDTLAEAPGGIKRLRALILDMAVRGKLVPQDPEDEPASVLLAQFFDQRNKLVKEKKIKRIKTAPLEEFETSEDYPNGWSLSRLGEISEKLGAGSTPRGGKNVYVDEGIKFLRSQNVWNHGLRLDGVAKIPLTIHQKMSGTWIQPGDILLNITGASIGRCAVVSDDFDDGNVSQHVAIIRLLDKQIRHFVHLCLISSLTQERIMSVQVGISREGLSMSRLKDFLIPIPPLAEQKRIVAKVDELMALCDRAEVAQQKRNTLRQNLRASALDALMNATSDTELETAWGFEREQWVTLCDRPEDVQNLRESILQMAVRGHLSSQSSNDESGTLLLNKIHRERDRMLKIKSIKKQKSLPKIDESKRDGLPVGWDLAYMQEITKVVTCGIASTPKYYETGKVFLSAKNIKPYRFMPENHKFVDEETFQKITQNAKPERGDILLTRVGAGIGEAAIIDKDIEFAYYVSLTLIKPFLDFLDSAYLLHWINSPEGVRKSIDNIYGSGVSQGNLNVGQVRRFEVPIPPLAEQKRIVAKVDELMQQCDRLETTLRKKQQIAEALVASATANLIA